MDLTPEPMLDDKIIKLKDKKLKTQLRLSIEKEKQRAEKRKTGRHTPTSFRR